MLRQWAKDEVLPKLAKVDWELIFNLDETSDAPRTEAKRKKVISTQPVNTIYTSAREDGHITLVPTIALKGTRFRTLVIVSTKSIHNELSDFGLPDNGTTLVVRSDSGYMNAELFKVYLEQLFIPDLNAERARLAKPDAWAGLVMDNADVHNTEEIKKILEKNRILPIWLLAYSSHLTQPLDLVIFAAYKHGKKVTHVSSHIVTAQARRIIKNIKALEQALNSHDIIMAWIKGGWSIDRSKTTPEAVFDITKILENLRAPVSDVKMEATHRPVKKRIEVTEGLTITARKVADAGHRALLSCHGSRNRPGGAPAWPCRR